MPRLATLRTTLPAHRTIVHVDLDAFYASVEQRDDASLRGRPVLVGGTTRRGVVAAASYEARQFGVHSAMPMATALRLCPDAAVVPPDLARYRKDSDRFFEILGRFSPLVESLSLDEAFVDCTASRRLFGEGVTIARKIKESVRTELGLVASAGVAASKFVAKIASDIEKPDGLCTVPAERTLEFLHPLPVSRLWGVGEVTRSRLISLGLTTIGDVAGYPEVALRGHLGDRLGTRLAQLARAEDERDVTSEHSPVSIGHEETFTSDKTSTAQLAPILVDQAERVASRLRKSDLRASIVVLKLKYGDFRLVTRRCTLDSPSSDGLVLARAAAALLERLEVSDESGKRLRVRLCGVSVAGLEDRSAPRQLTFEEPKVARGERVGDTLDAIEERFGAGAIKRGISLKKTKVNR